MSTNRNGRTDGKERKLQLRRRRGIISRHGPAWRLGRDNHLGNLLPVQLCPHGAVEAKHSFIEGKQLVFTGTGAGLFGLWIKWLLLIVITVGIYGFWVAPQIAKWKWEHTSFAY